jgi:hypothetical protein
MKCKGSHYTYTGNFENRYDELGSDYALPIQLNMTDNYTPLVSSGYKV